MDIDTLQDQLRQKEAQILELTLALVDKRLRELEASDIDHESRLRIVETSRTRFETLAWLAFGGGALSLINIIQTFAK